MHTLAAAGDSIWSDMFTFQIPATEKILRTIFVYTAVALLIRLFGRRILAQLNLSDLVVVLLLSEVEYATLRPGGAFDVALKRDEQDASTGELEAAVRRIELLIDDRFEALEARITLSRE